MVAEGCGFNSHRVLQATKALMAMRGSCKAENRVRFPVVALGWYGKVAAAGS